MNKTLLANMLIPSFSGAKKEHETHFKSYPLFLYTQTAPIQSVAEKVTPQAAKSNPTIDLNTTNEGIAIEDISTTIAKIGKAKTSLESLTETVGTATIHFATADYNTLFSKDSNEKAQIDAYITKVKELLVQKP